MTTTNSSSAPLPDHATHLFSPYDLNGKAIAPNRFFKSAMSEVLAVQGVHLPTDGHLRVYARWARGGTGIIVTGNVMIDPSALGEPGNVVLENDTHLDRFAAWADAVHQANPDAHVWMQINHPGKQTPKFLTTHPVAPSAVPLGKALENTFAPPRALNHEEIEGLIRRFATSAGLAQKAGFDGVQIHGAHGYLVSQFLSPHHNRRTDQWGGTPENRRRFALETYRAVRTAVGPDFPVSIKMNSADFQTGGFEGDEAFELIAALSAEGIDLIEISGGNYESPAMTGAKQSTTEREAYFLEFASKARNHTDAALAVTGGFRSVRAMEAAVASGATDFVGIARALTLDPDLPKHAADNPDYTCDVGRPSTGFRALDMMFMIAISYYESQIRRMARGQNPDPSMSAWRTVLQSGTALGKAAFRKRRA
ncbi:NADH:flavin oxidoreductase/NADH oxidase family protein [uncultured Tateyamaria sp.]|uniref:NADH:flavin oxidoreductase/NADH oxidase family protein n=1 Tax=uncultured Tateyamaria sp. TaxID=455651 RepID=UPI002627FA2C|nr:NADH:flavin oxidoreductase/NADH oxidase family protein [uncultured Tateyamaria sp.]